MRKSALLLLIISAISVCAGDIITVDDDGPADFNNIQDAIDDANYGDTINVAAGTYIENITLKNGVALIGQDPNVTIIDGNDNGSVVYCDQCDSNTVLEGFTITNGYAEIGGGMRNYQSLLKITDCIFSENIAEEYGGGMYNKRDSSPTISNCTFINNTTSIGGGGMSNIDNCCPIITDCNFIDNSADEEGGGIYNYDSNPILTNCTFRKNAAYSGGGIEDRYGAMTLVNCILNCNAAEYGGAIDGYFSWFSISNCSITENTAQYGGGTAYFEGEIRNSMISDNSAQYYGGGMYNSEVNPMLLNCIFSGNYAGNSGGGLYNTGMEGDSHPLLIGCTFAGNFAPNGNAIGCDSYNQTFPHNIDVSNCILWDGGEEIWNNDESIISITFSDLEGGQAAIYDPENGVIWGEGNIDVDPLFAEPGYRDPNGTPADTNDDFWAGGDYHLQSQAGRWDVDSESWVVDSNTSPCIDAGDWTTHVGFEPFPNGGRINMGAYGGTVEASKSYFGTEPCETIIAGDINGDCKVDFIDLAIMAMHWQEEN